MRGLSILICLASELPAQSIRVEETYLVAMPMLVDSNSPAFWVNGELRIFNTYTSTLLSRGVDQFLVNPARTLSPQVDSLEHFPMWIESVYWEPSRNRLYAWYHHEPGVCPGLTAPKIGALVSRDGGRTFQDLGIILDDGNPPNCNAKNGYFASGHGDFSVIVDREREYIYFLFGAYGGTAAEQGVSIARMPFEDRDDPTGKAVKFYNGDWSEPGLGGKVTPFLPATVGWESEKTDSFWGPSVHWNTHLEKFVVLLNRSCCEPGWPQSGIWATFNGDLSRPQDFTRPVEILNNSQLDFSPAWYPQILGLGPGETDSVAGEKARLYVKGLSSWEVTFVREPAVGRQRVPPTPKR
jgi:hypothetical protein